MRLLIGLFVIFMMCSKDGFAEEKTPVKDCYEHRTYLLVDLYNDNLPELNWDLNTCGMTPAEDKSKKNGSCPRDLFQYKLRLLLDEQYISNGEIENLMQRMDAMNQKIECMKQIRYIGCVGHEKAHESNCWECNIGDDNRAIYSGFLPKLYNDMEHVEKTKTIYEERKERYHKRYLTYDLPKQPFIKKGYYCKNDYSMVYRYRDIMAELNNDLQECEEAYKSNESKKGNICARDLFQYKLRVLLDEIFVSDKEIENLLKNLDSLNEEIECMKQTKNVNCVDYEGEYWAKNCKECSGVQDKRQIYAGLLLALYDNIGSEKEYDSTEYEKREEKYRKKYLGY